MSANPLEEDPEREHRIRDRAYHLWVEGGRPHGRHDEFWERASALVAMEENAGSGQLANPQTTGEDPTLGEPVEEASLQDNLGDFPDHLTDENEGRSTPKPRRSAKAAAPEKITAKPTAAKKSPETPPAKPSTKKASKQPTPKRQT